MAFILKNCNFRTLVSEKMLQSILIFVQFFESLKSLKFDTPEWTVTKINTTY